MHNTNREGAPRSGACTEQKAIMSNLTLEAKKRIRSSKGSKQVLRKQGRIPAIVYGLDAEPEMVEVSAVDMRAHLGHRNHVINLAVEGKSQQVLIKAVERDPIRKDLIHIDFLRVNDVRPVIVNVPVITHGIPVGVKTQGGVFATMKKFVKLRAKVQDVPEIFDIDVSEVSQGTIFYVRDLKFEKGTFVTPAKTALFGVTAGKAEVEEVAAAPAAAAAAPTGAPSAPGVAPKGDAKDDKKGGKDKK